MAAIKLLTGTTEDYQETESYLILDEREIAVEIVTDDSGNTYYNIRQGDGKSTFFDLPVIVNNSRYEELNTILAVYYDTIQDFSTNLYTATASANAAATSANEAADAANAAAENISNLTSGLNSIVDDVTSDVYTLGIESGILYLDDGEDDSEIENEYSEDTDSSSDTESLE